MVFRKAILHHDIPAKATICIAQCQRLSQALVFICKSPNQFVNRRLNIWCKELNLLLREERVLGSSTDFMEVMVNSCLTSGACICPLTVRKKLVSTIAMAVVDGLIEFRIADMKLPGIDTNDWSFMKLISRALMEENSIPTISIMKILQVEGELASFHDIVIKLIPRCRGC